MSVGWMNTEMTDQEIAALRAFTNIDDLTQQSTADTSALGSEIPETENLTIDLDGAPRSLFATQPGQIHQNSSGFQTYSQQSHTFSSSAGFLNPRLTHHYSSGFQNSSTRSQAPSSGFASANPGYPEHNSSDHHDVLNSSVAPPSFPPAPAGINPGRLASALQAATTASSPAIPGGGFFPTTFFSHHHQQQQHPDPHPFPPCPLLSRPPQPTPTQNMHLQQPSLPPPQELLSDYPQLHRTHHTNGYRDGVSHARALHAQPAFDAGYPLGMALGLHIGKILGVVQMAMAGSQDAWAHQVMGRARIELELNGLLRDMETYRMEEGIRVGSWTMDGNGNGNGNVPFASGPTTDGSMLGWSFDNAFPRVNTGVSAASSTPTVGASAATSGGQIQPTAPISAPDMHPGAQPAAATGPTFGGVQSQPPPAQQQHPPPPPPPQQQPHQQQQLQPQLQPQPTVARFGPPPREGESQYSLNVYAALRQWELFALSWMHGKAQSVLDGAKPL